ncbi:MAG: phosphoesterase, partial [Methanospirillum sp.]|uniref:DHH family phosphoesterase n=1 Tax=Methanospirillum sp. TaxID=45200 RepID=UPI00236C55FE
YSGTIQGFAAFGTFVYLNSSTKGLVHKSNMLTSHQEGDTILVRVGNVRDNGNIDLEEVIITSYQVQPVVCKKRAIQLGELKGKVGRRVMVECVVAQVKQTSGPTIFTLIDATGSENAAGFVEAGKRAFPDANQGDVVRATGEVMQRGGQVQIELENLSVLRGSEADEVLAGIEHAIDVRAEPPEVPLLVESEVLEKLRPAMRKIAKIIRRAVFTAQPILLRHHADADGICSAVSIEQAVISLINESGGDYDADYYLFKRAPSKAPFYEIEDIVRDLDYATRDNIRFGQKMPLVLLTDNGSTEEDLPAMKMAKVYGIPMIVFDHHHPDEIVDQYLEAHVNPYHVGGDYGITAGMLGTEIARLISPAVDRQIRHIAAVAGVADRSDAPERTRYLELSADRFSEVECKRIALALDYIQFYLRFNDGKELIKDILDLNGNHERHLQMVSLLEEEANTAITEQVKTCMPHVGHTVLGNGAHLFTIDVEIHAHKFTFPPPGKTCGEVHDRLCQQYAGEPVVTLGFGPDFVVLRSRGVLMNIPRMVRELRDDLPGAGVNGGGHLVVGSIKFVEGMRQEVTERLSEKIAQFSTVE